MTDSKNIINNKTIYLTHFISSIVIFLLAIIVLSNNKSITADVASVSLIAGIISLNLLIRIFYTWEIKNKTFIARSSVWKSYVILQKNIQMKAFFKFEAKKNPHHQNSN
jgi:hypothetical protein